MESRFGIKDVFLFLLLSVLVIVVVLAMVQYDRQWQTMQQTNRLLTEQTTDLARIDRLLAQGVRTQTAGGPAAVDGADALATAFPRIIKAQSAPDYAPGGQLTLLSQATSPKITAMIATDAFAANEVWGSVMESLLNRDPDSLQWLPNLATSWKVSDDSLKIDFTIRKGVTFSDGSPLTADDVVYTFDEIRNPDIEDPGLKVGVEKLDRVEKVNDYAVRFVFREPYFQSFETAAGMPILSKAFYSRYTPADINSSTGLLIGSGPYRMPDPTSWRPQPGQPFVLVRNERYWGPKPSFDRMVWNVISQPSARVTAFRNGDLDFLGGDNPPTPEQYTGLSTDSTLTNTRHWALTSPLEAFYFLAWNEKVGRDGKPTPFADARVRRAMTMLTDRDAILRTIINGHGTKISGPFAPTVPQCDPSIQPYPYDPVAAEKLLNEAGFHRQGDRMIGPDGQPFSFKLTFNTNSEPRRRIASLLHDAYAKVGIDAEPENAEWSIFVQRMDDRQYQAVIGASGGALERDLYDELDSSQMAKTGSNIVQYSNPAMDAAIAKARSTVEESKRMPLWHEVHHLIHDEQPYTYLFMYQELDIARDRIHGMTPTKDLGLAPTMGEWYFPAALQTAR